MGKLFTSGVETGAIPIRPRREPRTRKYGVVTGPLEEPVTIFKSPIVEKEANNGCDGRGTHSFYNKSCCTTYAYYFETGNEETEDNYETLREAALEHWVTMKKYYRAVSRKFF